MLLVYLAYQSYLDMNPAIYRNDWLGGCSCPWCDTGMNVTDGTSLHFLIGVRVC